MTELPKEDNVDNIEPSLQKIKDYNRQLKHLQQKKQRELKKAIPRFIRSLQALGITIKDLEDYERGRKSPARKASAVAGVTKRGGKKGKKTRAGKSTKGLRRGLRKSQRSSPKGSGSDGRSKVAPKYFDQATNNSWSGRGKAPRWLVEYEQSGRQRSDFLVEPAESTEPTAPTQSTETVDAVETHGSVETG